MGVRIREARYGEQAKLEEVLGTLPVPDHPVGHRIGEAHRGLAARKVESNKIPCKVPQFTNGILTALSNLTERDIEIDM